MTVSGNIDPTLHALGDLGLYQTLQVVVQGIGSFGAAFQLLDNIFIGRNVEDFSCAAPDSNLSILELLNDQDVNGWNSSRVTYGECEISVSKDNLSTETKDFDCVNGYNYSYDRELSFRTEFNLVCDRKLLGSLAQTFLIIGQGIGAVLSSMVSDRFGRKPTLVGSQLGLLVCGIIIGLAPFYSVLALFKFFVGGFQQGVLTGMSIMAIELYSTEQRNMQVLITGVLWACGSTSMALFAFIMRGYTWRYLQYILSGASLFTAILQQWYLDESLRWLVANGKKEETMRVLQRAAKLNGKDLNVILDTLKDDNTDSQYNKANTISLNGHDNSGFSLSSEEEVSPSEDKPELRPELKKTRSKKMFTLAGRYSRSDAVPSEAVLTVACDSLKEKEAEKLTVLDIFRHKHILSNSVITWIAWFTCAFSYFGLYMMSTSLHGDRFLNYFLTALMELPPVFVFYFAVNRLGRKTASQILYMIAGIGLVGSGVSGIFDDISALQTLSVVFAMVGMFGASGVFSAVYFFTPELFPTNLRNQALGVSSFAGRLGGMISPFMSDLATIAIWAPGVVSGGLCFLVVFLLRFIPETTGRELPNTIEDINAWYKKTGPKETTAEKNGDLRSSPRPTSRQVS